MTSNSTSLTPEHVDRGTVRSLTLRVNGLRIHTRLAGAGPAFLLLHGWPQTSYAWRKLVPLLSPHATVIAPDLRGFGNSSKPAAGYDKKTVASDLAALLDALHIDKACVVGHDMGGQVGYAFAALYPQLTDRFVFIESGLPGFGQENAMNVATGGSWHFGFNMAGDISEELVRGREALFVRHFVRRDTVGTFDASSITEEDINVYATALTQPGALRASFSYYRTLFVDRDDNLQFGQKKLEMPVLAVGCDFGYGGGSKATMDRVASNVRGVVLNESGHYPAEEQPYQLASVLLDFLG
ncbi:alpha/beta hydrolase [Burkholderia cenocepacia]|uniref:alpha/beta fold hydrolase n=1 Tax=Burkholderia cenocepacia TaxID=95486 RepID=UPI001B8F5F62|nr:alpha/beta hydrolase [Burkholderia cenocepacia]MBR8030147.1 alpha/beta hydrolase [Burkholderia cenocepacia]MBR8174025.1 alpha/beta hydrolase [Burkholderia cenocepacia]